MTFGAHPLCVLLRSTASAHCPGSTSQYCPGSTSQYSNSPAARKSTGAHCRRRPGTGAGAGSRPRAGTRANDGPGPRAYFGACSWAKSGTWPRPGLHAVSDGRHAGAILCAKRPGGPRRRGGTVHARGCTEAG